MECVLCTKTIEGYDPARHLLRIREGREVSICEACAQAFAQWQMGQLARLFPTKRMKEWNARRK